MSMSEMGSGGSKATEYCAGGHTSGSILHETDARFGGVARGYVWCRELQAATWSECLCFGRVFAHIALAAFLRCVRNLLLLFGTLSTAPSIFIALTAFFHYTESIFDAILLYETSLITNLSPNHNREQCLNSFN